jgi:hypothetical protein
MTRRNHNGIDSAKKTVLITGANRAWAARSSTRPFEEERSGCLPEAAAQSISPMTASRR